MKTIYNAPGIKVVTSRPVKARAMQLIYGEGSEETRLHVRSIEACLGVKMSCVDDQGALFVHLKLDHDRNPIVNGGDWILVDSFGKVSVVKDSEFKIYYDPE